MPREILLRNLTNIPGWLTERKIVVIESDDWGSIRMPSRSAYNNLLKAGIRVDRSRYDMLDSLEKESDMSALLNVLNSIKSQNKQSPVFTLNTVMANPDFAEIEKNNYQEYHYQLFFNSYEQYYGQRLESLWHKGISEKLIQPQFHAREHLNTSLWINDLRQGIKNTLKAFQQNFFGLKTKTSSSHQNHYLAAYWVRSLEDTQEKISASKQGLDLFEKSFGFRSRSFIACNSIWPTEIESSLKAFGVKFIQGQRVQRAPVPGKDKMKAINHYTGQRNREKQLYLVRNAFFEPYLNPDRDWVNTCMREIANSFFWAKPAIISSHRINYVSNMNVAHRDKNLKMLEQLMQRIMDRWPDVEFMSSDQAGELILSTQSEIIIGG